MRCVCAQITELLAVTLARLMVLEFDKDGTNTLKQFNFQSKFQLDTQSGQLDSRLEGNHLSAKLYWYAATGGSPHSKAMFHTW